MNQAVFERFLVGEDGIEEAELSGAFEILLAPDLLTTESRRPSWLAERLSALSAVVAQPRPAFAGFGLNRAIWCPS
jgi:hypothetical protein